MAILPAKARIIWLIIYVHGCHIGGHNFAISVVLGPQLVLKVTSDRSSTFSWWVAWTFFFKFVSHRVTLLALFTGLSSASFQALQKMTKTFEETEHEFTWSANTFNLSLSLICMLRACKGTRTHVQSPHPFLNSLNFSSYIRSLWSGVSSLSGRSRQAAVSLDTLRSFRANWARSTLEQMRQSAHTLHTVYAN